MSENRTHISDQKWDRVLKAMSRREFILSVAATGVLTLIPRFVSAAAGKPYKLGLLLPVTGTGANYADGAIKAVTNAVAEINGRGGFLGKHPIEISFRDTHTKPDVAAREARDVISRDNVQTIVGTYSSACAMAIQEIIHERKILHLAATSNSSKIVNENYTPYTYQFCPNSKMQAGSVVVAVSEMIKKNNWGSYVTIGQDYEWGRDTQKQFVDALGKKSPNTKLSKELWFRLGETEFSSYISAVMASKPDFLFGAIAGKDNRTFIRQAQGMGLFKRIPYPGGLISVTELQQQRRSIPRGMIGLARCPFFAHLDQPLMQKYIKMHIAKYGEDAYPTDWACMHYDAIYGLEQKITEIGSIETEAVRKGLKSATLDTCRGKATFRDCNNQLNIPAGYVGAVWDSPDYPFPIYKPDTMVIVKAEDVWTPTCDEVRKLQKKRA
ncbi:MAG: ABC transporter substrate-binding protein [Deltaproteobacteria bacterium]|nr:ABC transporter substrate-binding protein [Deltaproteobacteria bacterium]